MRVFANANPHWEGMGLPDLAARRRGRRPLVRGDPFQRRSPLQVRKTAPAALSTISRPSTHPSAAFRQPEPFHQPVDVHRLGQMVVKARRNRGIAVLQGGQPAQRNGHHADEGR